MDDTQLQILAKLEALERGQQRIERRLGLLGSRREIHEQITQERAERRHAIDRGAALIRRQRQSQG